MKALRKIHVTVWLLGLAGAALFTILLIRQGLPQVGAAFATAGWAIAAVVAFHFAVPVFFDAVAWWVLFPKSERPALLQLLWMRWSGSLPLSGSMLSSDWGCSVLSALSSQSWLIRRNGIRSGKAATHWIKQFESCTRAEAVWWDAVCGRLFRWCSARGKSGSRFK